MVSTLAPTWRKYRDIYIIYIHIIKKKKPFKKPAPGVRPNTSESVGGLLGGAGVPALSWALWPEGRAALLSSPRWQALCPTRSISFHPLWEPPER